MLCELCNPVTIRSVAPGNPLDEVEELCSSLLPGLMACQRPEEIRSSLLPGLMACQRAERLAAAIVIRIVLLSALMGYTVAAMDEPQRGRDDTSGPRGFLTQGIVFAGTCGILPVTAGTAGRKPRTLLHR